MAKPVPVKAVDGISSAKATVEVRQGALEFTVHGDAGQGQRWFIPLRTGFSFDGEIVYSVTSLNLRSRKRVPNLYLRLVPHALRRSEPGKGQHSIVPIFSAVGTEDGAVGRVEVSMVESQTTAPGFFVDLELRKKGVGHLIIETLTVTVQANFLTKAEVRKRLADPPSVTAAMDVGDDGIAFLTVDGKPVAPIFMEFDGTDPPVSKENKPAGRGIVLRRVLLNLTAARRQGSAAAALVPFSGYMDFSGIDRILGAACSPDHVRVMMLLALTPDLAAKSAMSDLSPEWLAEADGKIRQVLAHVRAQAYADKVIGCTFLLGKDDLNEAWPGRDTQRAYRNAFRVWLRNKYANDAAWRAAWGLDRGRINKALPLPASKWPAGTVGSIMHPALPARGLDCRDFYCLSWTESLIARCRLVKSLTGGRYLTGISGGPSYFGHEPFPRQTILSPALEKVLSSTDVDILEISQAKGDETSPAAQLLAALCRRKWKLPVHAMERGVPIIDQRSSLIAAVTSGAGIRLDPAAAVDKRDRGELDRWRMIMKRSQALRRGSGAEVAVVVDPGLYRWLAPRSGVGTRKSSPRYEWRRALFDASVGSWSRVGAPYDIVLLHELDPNDYRVLIFFHTLQLGEKYDRLLAKCKRDGRVLIWIWADGLISGKTLAPNRMKTVTGMKIRMHSGAADFQIYPTRPYFTFIGKRGTARDRIIPVTDRMLTFSLAPSFVIDDKKAKILARTIVGGHGAIASRSFKDWTSIYCTVPVVPPALVRAALRSAGGHITLSAQDVAVHDRNFVGFVPESAGIRMIRLRKEQALYEVLRDQELAPAKSHRVEIEKDVPYLFFKGSKAAWDRAE